jgi:hypothetical protein
LMTYGNFYLMMNKVTVTINEDLKPPVISN